MIMPNWNAYKEKFSDNPQRNFEWFCYLLFCKEFERPYGIFRYVNQAGMETNPVNDGDGYTAWEAKFYYEVNLSDRESEFIKKLKTAKRKNPEITKMYFYTPIDWTESSKPTSSKTAQQENIEKCAKELNIEVVWRGASFFESPFVSIQNEIIAKHFFSPDRDVFDFIKEQQTHSENILNEIQTSITFNDQIIEIDRSKELERLNSDFENVAILSGVGGVGKTAIIKKLHEQLKGKIPLYIFKATEFELRDISDLFRETSLEDFIEAHKDENNKIIVVDSAEKLLDLKNTDPFKEFISILVQENWKLIFTTRDDYLEDLNYHFFEIYRIIPSNINIQDLELKELGTISDQYNFSLPKEEKLLDLIKNPFYLNEYLKFYKDNEELNYIDFKEKLWNKIIKRSKPAREQCFLRIAFERANEGQFFVTPDCEPRILDDELKGDGILGYESPHGYFITHDIYEEWALEKIIEREFAKKTNNQEFFENIGHALPIRRSFRKWASEQLLLEETSIKGFIEEIIEDGEIESFWKDETLVSVLLSDYSELFFKNFINELLINNQELLKRSAFLLRIACKEVDEDSIKLLRINDLDLFSLKYVLTKPKGHGWKSLVKFTFENLDKIGIKNISFVLPIIHDWNSKFKEGTTTRLSSLIALQYYQMMIEEDNYFSRDDIKDLLQTILYGSFEIKKELKEIFDEIIKNRWKNHIDPYYDLSHTILTTFDGMTVYKDLPECILKIADLFWSYTPIDEDYSYHSNFEIEQYFGIEENNSDYFPASSYQTPTYWLLKYSLKKTIDFILNFTNKAIEFYAKSDLDKSDVKEVDIFIEKNCTLRQYISIRIWNIYRGTQVSPYVLESMHAALEKFLLDIGKYAASTTLENILLYLITNSKSASISAIVTSIVLAYPEKTFNVAKILFKTKEFFVYDASRLAFDQTHKSSLLKLKNNFGTDADGKIHENERLEACDEKHRIWNLENQFLKYQFFRNEETSEEEAKKMKTDLWGILDDYYKKLPDESEETESDKVWRLFLARMDSRKMHPMVEATGDGVLINFNPEIDPTLEEYRKKSTEKFSEAMKHTPLKLWAHYKITNDDKYKQYEQYENNPKIALKEVKEIILKLNTVERTDYFKLQVSEESSFYLVNYSIPADVCSVLIRDYFEELSIDEKIFCKDIILKVASLPLLEGYVYQVSDGTQSAISVLPVLLDKFPKDKENTKVILLLNSFLDYSINMMGDSFNVFSIMAIQKIWENNFDDAQSILFGYLILKPKYEAIKKNLLRENYKDFHRRREYAVIEKFLENETDLKRFVDNQLFFDDLKDIKQLDLFILNVAFRLIPLKTDNKEHKIIVRNITSAFIQKLISADRSNKIDYYVRYVFINRFAYFVLSSPKEEIKDYLKPFLDNFNCLEIIPDLFNEFIYAEDHLFTYENFWAIWDLFNPNVVELCTDREKNRYTEDIVKSYLFAQIHWKENITEWRTLKNENKKFFKNISEKIGYYPQVLYAISKLLNNIGSHYLNGGISWISGILQNNKSLSDIKLETNTIYYLENLCKKYIYENREKIRKTKKLKLEVLTLLNFLINKGSVVGYILRENIL